MELTPGMIIVETWRALRRVGMAAAIILGGIVAFFVTSVWWSNQRVFSTSEFDSSAWLAPVASDASTSCYRGGMANDIRSRVLEARMPKQQVEQLLGRPDRVDADRGNTYRYVLGMCSGLGWDYDDLHIYFDGAGRVERAAIIQH